VVSLSKKRGDFAEQSVKKQPLKGLERDINENGSYFWLFSLRSVGVFTSNIVFYRNVFVSFLLVAYIFPTG